MAPPRVGRRPGAARGVPRQGVGEGLVAVLRIGEAGPLARDLRPHVPVIVRLRGARPGPAEEPQEVARQGAFVALDGEAETLPGHFLGAQPGGHPDLEQRVAGLGLGRFDHPEVRHQGEGRLAVPGAIKGAGVIAPCIGTLLGHVVVEIDLPAAAARLGDQPASVQPLAEGHVGQGLPGLDGVGGREVPEARLEVVVDEVRMQGVALEVPQCPPEIRDPAGLQGVDRVLVLRAELVEVVGGAGGGEQSRDQP